MAEARLQSAAKLEIAALRRTASGSDLRFEVAVQNVAAGHNLPSGVTELRRIWVELHVTDGSGATLYRTGQADDHGDFGPNTLWFGALAADASGKPTYKLWKMRGFSPTRHSTPRHGADDLHDETTGQSHRTHHDPGSTPLPIRSAPDRCRNHEGRRVHTEGHRNVDRTCRGGGRVALGKEQLVQIRDGQG